MESPQNTLIFPSPELQNAVKNLWGIIQHTADSLNSITEENIALKLRIDELSTNSGVNSEVTDSLRDEIASLGSELLIKENEISQLNQKIETFDHLQINYDQILYAYDNAKQEINSLQEQIDLLQTLQKNSEETELNYKHSAEEVQRKNVQLISASEEILQLNNLISELRNQFDKLNKNAHENVELRAKLDSEENRVKVLNSELNKLRFDYDVLKSEAQIENNKLSKEHEELALLINSLNAKNLVLDSTLHDERTRNESLNIENTMLQDENSKLKVQILDNESNYSINENTSSKLTFVENELAQTKNNLLITEKQLNDLRSKENEFNEKIELLESEIENYFQNSFKDSTEIASLHQIIKQKELKIAESAQEIQVAHGNNLSENEMLIEQLESEIKDKDLRLIELKQFESEFHKLRQEIADIKASGEEKVKQLKLSSEERIELESRVFNLTTESNKLRMESETSAFKIQSLENDIKILQSKLKESELKSNKAKQAYTLDDAIKESLINKIEEQLNRINKIIN